MRTWGRSARYPPAIAAALTPFRYALSPNATPNSRDFLPAGGRPAHAVNALLRRAEPQIGAERAHGLRGHHGKTAPFMTTREFTRTFGYTPSGGSIMRFVYRPRE